MDLGVRHIRTAGRGSGSIELTLPTDLRDLVGLPCRITLRDGDRPDIVLQPDLRRAHQAFAEIWSLMAATLLREEDAAPALPLAAFTFGLQPRATGGDVPFLCWRDGLALAAPAPHDPSAISRTMAAFGHAMAPLLHIDRALAAGFGATCGYVVAGLPPTADARDACSLAAGALRMARRDQLDPSHAARPASPSSIAAAAVTACAEGILGDEFWRRATPLLVDAAELFVTWTADPTGHTALRAAWRRGRAIEMSGD